MNAYVANAMNAQRRRSMVGAMGFRTPQLVGAGYPSLVGAAPMGGPVSLLGQNPGSMGTAIVPGQPTEARLWILPFPATNVGAGGVATQSIASQVPLTRPNRLIITETTGPSSLTDIQIGQRSQFIAAGSCPIAAFGPTAVDTLVSFDTATTGQNINLFLANAGAGATVVTSTALCTVAI